VGHSVDYLVRIHLFTSLSAAFSAGPLMLEKPVPPFYICLHFYLKDTLDRTSIPSELPNL
jgi:hypothetical protein